MDGLSICLLGHLIKLHVGCIEALDMTFIKQSTNIIVEKNLKMLMVNLSIIFLLLLDMRKSMPRDKDKVTMKPTGKKIEPSELEFH